MAYAVIPITLSLELNQDYSIKTHYSYRSLTPTHIIVEEPVFTVAQMKEIISNFGRIFETSQELNSYLCQA